MRTKSIGRSLLVSSLAVISGCSLITKPENIRVGINVRQVKGRHRIFDEEKIIPYYRIQANKHINNEWDYFLRGDFTNGELDLSPRYIDGSARGDIQSIGGGISYLNSAN